MEGLFHFINVYVTKYDARKREIEWYNRGKYNPRAINVSDTF